MSKKAQLSINTIIVAVIALIVLVILIAIFTGKFTGFRKSIDVQEQRAVSLQDYFEGYGCQQKVDACTKININDCERVGCSLNTNRDCVGESRLCQNAGETKCKDELGGLKSDGLCKWVDPPRSS